jgi:hypothetical protein
MFKSEFITISIILSFLIIYPLTQLHKVGPDKTLPQDKIILLIIRISVIITFANSIYIFLAGIYLITDWHPFINASSADLAIQSVKGGGKGGIFIIIIKFLPYLMIAWSLLNLFTSSMGIGYYFFHKSWTK